MTYIRISEEEWAIRKKKSKERQRERESVYRKKHKDEINAKRRLRAKKPVSDKRREYRRRWYTATKTQRAEYTKKWRAENPELARSYARKYKASQDESLREYRRAHAENRELDMQWLAVYRDAHMRNLKRDMMKRKLLRRERTLLRAKIYAKQCRVKHRKQRRYEGRIAYNILKRLGVEPKHLRTRDGKRDFSRKLLRRHFPGVLLRTSPFTKETTE